jgi:prepilin-type N-terminal cleavage/methylation domain-containing protein/prepilin-type processing-associated H-X9-DG protein
MLRYHLSHRRGFTLIELLTVIAIIGILAAILIPTVGLVRKKARAAECVSRLRQIGVAVRLYADENKGYVVPDRIDGANNWGPILVPYMAMKTVNGLQLADLPAGSDYSKDPRFFYMCPDSPIPVKWRAWGNYATHPVIMAKVPSTQPWGSFKLAAIPRPSRVILIADGSQITTGGGGGPGDTHGAAGSNTCHFSQTYNGTSHATQSHDAPADTGNPNTDGVTGWIRYRHNNVANCLYVDGHVKGHPRGTFTYGNFIER